jgi:hypothetical protein
VSVEHTPEHRGGPEQSSAELETAARERLEQLKHHESAETDDSGRRAEAAREVIHRQEQQPKHEQTPAAETHKQHPVHRILNPQLNYAHTLASLQRRLKPAQRTFSKVIHTPVVERTSEALEKTVARPSVTAGAGWTAFAVGLVFYLTARRYGYTLSGSEMIASFFVGGLLGLVLEWLWRGLRHRRHNHR